MKFRKKPVVIEAFQMTRERRVDNQRLAALAQRSVEQGPQRARGGVPSKSLAAVTGSWSFTRSKATTASTSTTGSFKG